MGWRNDAQGFGSTAKLLHWTAAACVLTAWLIGVVGDDPFPKPWKGAILFTHVSFGLLVLATLLGRLGWRVASPAPAAIATRFEPWMGVAALVAHILLYALLLMVPLSGIVLQFARGQAVPLFGLYEIASPWVRDRAFARSVKEVHEIFAHMLLGLAVLHAAAALVHHHLLKDDTLARMLPGGGRRYRGRNP
ncbi:MAG: cytochrome b/b6 domain-containing protein [Reyranella sp.]|nr:cytochrome b/b6 domain-containing protein [Reyranella sp.]